MTIDHGTDLRASALGRWEARRAWETHTDVSEIEDKNMPMRSTNGKTCDEIDEGENRANAMDDYNRSER